jgi:hypothetical protein
MGLTVILIALAGICNAVMDTIRDHYYISILPQNRWWESRNWKDKYVDYLYSDRVWWYYMIFPFYNAWNTFKYFMIFCFIVSIAFYQTTFGVGDTLILAITFAFNYLLFYKYLLIKKYDK